MANSIFPLSFVETNQDTGLSRGGRNTKIHAVVDALGNPVKLYLVF
jgi:hypothetical protein